MRNILLASLSATCLLGAADPPGTPVADPPASLCKSKADAKVVAPATALLKGYGTGGFAIRTSNPEAQAYFDNGMQLAHAFAHDAAVAAFKRAVELDPACAMCAWGEAWSRGPTINYPVDAATQVELAAIVDRAARLAADGPPKERAWIAALGQRYRDGGGSGPGDLAFARAMDDLARAYPADDEVAVVAADAWMIPASHDDNRRHLDRSLELLQTVLARSPDDSGAIHFYIHATEMNGVGAKALPYAQRLQAAAPAASHLVHMPSHTYFWVGQFRAAAQANLDAVALDRAEALRNPSKDGPFGLMYFQHNVQFGTVSALIGGDGESALALARAMVERLPALAPGPSWPQVAMGSAYAAYGRFANDAEIDALPEPEATLPLARAMWRYARGEAAARRGDAAAVRQVASTITIRSADLAPMGDSADRAKAMVIIARLVLEGRAAMLDRRWGDAVTAYRKAADLQDEEIGTGGDPPAWWYPVRRSLAAALLADGRIAEADEEIHRTLLVRVGDPLSERIYADVHAASRRPDEAARWLAAARANWTGDPTAVPLALL